MTGGISFPELLGRKRAALAALALLSLPGCSILTPRQSNTSSDVNRPSLIAARNAMQQGEAETALSIARGVLTSEPHNAAALVAAGDASEALHIRLDAEKYFRDALAAHPGYVPARIGQGKLKLRDNAKGAEAEFRTVLVIEPQNTAALTDLGVALDLQERHKEAQAAYNQALALNPDLTAARVNLGLSLALDGQAPKAEDMLRDASQAGTSSAKVRADFALAEVLAGHAEQAEATLQADLSADEAHASVQTMSALMPPDAVKKN